MIGLYVHIFGNESRAAPRPLVRGGAGFRLDTRPWARQRKACPNACRSQPCKDHIIDIVFRGMLIDLDQIVKDGILAIVYGLRRTKAMLRSAVFCNLRCVNFMALAHRRGRRPRGSPGRAAAFCLIVVQKRPGKERQVGRKRRSRTLLGCAGWWYVFLFRTLVVLARGLSDRNACGKSAGPSSILSNGLFFMVLNGWHAKC